MTPALTRITQARLAFVTDAKLIFWARGVMQLTPVESNDSRYYMATDGIHLLYNAKWTETVDFDELVTTVAHEVGHCYLQHVTRRADRDPKRWNIACDYKVNTILKKAGFDFNDNWQWVDDPHADLSAEEHYELIPPQPEGMIISGGAVIDPEGATSESLDAQSLEWELIAKQAAFLAKEAGLLPSSMEELLKPKKVKLDPATILRRFIQTARREQYSWARPNRRHLYRNLYLPSLQGEGLDSIVIGIDTSGSIRAAEAERFFGFTNRVLKELRPTTTWLIQCDAAVRSVERFHAGESLPDSVKMRGRGGTNMRPIWKFLADTKIKPVCAVVLSDMEMPTQGFGTKQSFPVLWLSTNPKAKGPFGQTFYLGE